MAYFLCKVCLARNLEKQEILRMIKEGNNYYNRRENGDVRQEINDHNN